MRTGIDILFDKAEAKGKVQGIIESAVRLVSKGKSLQEAVDLLDLSDEQREEVEARAGLRPQMA